MNDLMKPKLNQTNCSENGFYLTFGLFKKNYPCKRSCLLDSYHTINFLNAVVELRSCNNIRNMPLTECVNGIISKPIM